jgi:hypothetical protein
MNQGLTKEEIKDLRVNTNIFILKNAARVGDDLCCKVGINFQDFLTSKGLGHQKYTKTQIEKAQLWKSLSTTEKNLICEWYDSTPEHRRKLIYDLLAIKTDAKIDDYVIRFENFANYFADFYNDKSFDSLEEISQDLIKNDEDFEPGNLIIKLTRLFLDEINDNGDISSLGDTVKNFLELLSKATGKPLEVLAYTSVELLFELFIRIFAKGQAEVDESFFVSRIVKFFIKSLGLSNFMKIEI